MTHINRPNNSSPRAGSIAASSAAAGAFIALLGTWAIGGAAAADTPSDVAAGSSAQAQHSASTLPSTVAVPAEDDPITAMCVEPVTSGTTSPSDDSAGTGDGPESGVESDSHERLVDVDVDVDADVDAGDSDSDMSNGGGDNGAGHDNDSGSGDDSGSDNGADTGNGGDDGTGNGSDDDTGDNGDTGDTGDTSNGGSLIDADVDLGVDDVLDDGGLLDPNGDQLLDADVDLDVLNDTTTGTNGRNLLDADVLGVVDGLLGADADAVVGDGDHGDPSLIDLDALALVGTD